ncbi:MAG: hypothetical protein HS129_11615 [Leptospiraceae bacterium]|nr:hypothetical protein [Leptospiraceae bacterium]
MKKEASLVESALGLNYSIEYLESLFLVIIDYPLVFMAKFADRVCQSKVEKITLSEITSFDFNFGNFNTTSIGNLAFVAINTKDRNIREGCFLILDRFRDHLKTLDKKK